MEQLFTQKELAEYFKVHLSTIKRWCAEDAFPNAIYIGGTVRIPLSDIKALKGKQGEAS